MKYLLILALLFASTVQATEPCPINLGGLTQQQFGVQADQLAAKIDRQLEANTVYTLKTITVDGQSVVVPATLSSWAKVEITREHPGVLEYTLCNLTHFGFTYTITTENKKVFLNVKNYRVLN